MEWLKRPINNVDDDIIPFWDGLKRHEFLLFRCGRCGSHYWPMAYCRNHDDIPSLDDMEWAPTSGKGNVFAFVIVHQVQDRAFDNDIPYALAEVELDEGPIFATRIRGCDAHDVAVGMPVEVDYEDAAETGITWPFFRPRA